MTSNQLDVYWTQCRFYASEFSSDSETKVGAAIIGTRLEAANTFVTNAKRLPSTRPDKYPYIIHAEQNLIFQAAREGISLDGKKVFCTLSPCQACIRAMFQVGIREVYYRDLYNYHNIEMADIKVTETKVGPYTKMVLENYV